MLGFVSWNELYTLPITYSVSNLTWLSIWSYTTITFLHLFHILNLRRFKVEININNRKFEK